MRRLLPALLLAITACSNAVPEAEPFLGVWASQGWGIILHVHEGDADIYEISATHCLLASSGSARNIDDFVAIDGRRLVLTDGGRVVYFEPLTDLPAECSATLDASPPAVVDAVVAAVEEHFHPGVDPGWAGRVAALTPPAAGDEAALLAAITELLAPLGDPEIALQAGTEPIWAPSPGGAGAALAAALVDGTLLPGATISGGNGIVALDLGGGVQYLGLLRLGGFADSSDGSQRVIAAALDQSLRQATGLVLDLRAATTGAETEALLVATRFVSQRTVVATIEARVDDGGGRIHAGDAVVNPMPTGPFAGRVVVLVGAGTAGPAELLALALASLPNVTILGEPTAGSPRSPLVRTLPNGWVLGVPNTEVTVTGVPRVGNPLLPGVTAVLTGDDIAGGRDPGLEAARLLLGP